MKAGDSEGFNVALKQLKRKSKNVEELLHELNAPDLDGLALMHHAARSGYADILSVLLENGARVDVPNLKVQATPLMKGMRVIVCCLPFCLSSL